MIINRKLFAALAAITLTMSVASCGVKVGDDAATITKKAVTTSVQTQASTDATEPAETTAAATTSAADSTADKKDTDTQSTGADALLESMTLEEKVGQLFVVRPDVFESDDSTKTANDSDSIGVTWLDDEMKETLENYPVGGVIMFAMNITDPDQITKFNADFQSVSEIPMFIAVDEEGGQVARIGNNSNFNVTTYDSMEAIGNTGDTNQAYEAGKTIGSYLTQYGFNLDFAPDSDVNTNPDNIVIGDRAFGSDPQVVADMVSSAIDGFHDANMMTCIKHFPGHGDTKGDTHEGYVSVEKTWDDLKTCELIPFVQNIDSTDLVMAAHITVPNITDDGLPASMSKQMITDKLRGELGYNGVVTTDAMGMGAISQNYTSAEGAVSAVEAGVDIVLMPENLGEAYDAVIDAVNNGEISEERLDESVLRILNLKAKYGLIK